MDALLFLLTKYTPASITHNLSTVVLRKNIILHTFYTCDLSIAWNTLLKEQ